MYYKALVDGLVKIPSIPIAFRNKVRKLHRHLGQKTFYKKLIKIDPISTGQIKSTDVQRSIRAYEVKIIYKKINFTMV